VSQLLQITSKLLFWGVWRFLAFFANLALLEPLWRFLGFLAILAPLWRFYCHFQSFVTYNVQKKSFEATLRNFFLW
jgi:hypothetical protein